MPKSSKNGKNSRRGGNRPSQPNRNGRAMNFDIAKFRGPDPLPPVLWKVFNVSAEFAVTNAANAVYGTQDATFRLNGPFEPKSAGSHQPYGWDQYSGLYSRFMVHRAEVTITCSTASTSGQYLGMVVLGPSDTSDLTGEAIASVSERNTGQAVPIVPNKVTKIRWGMNLWDFMGISKTQYVAEGSHAGLTASANPTLITATLAVATANSGSAAGACTGIITVKYFTQLFGRLTQAQS